MTGSGRSPTAMSRGPWKSATRMAQAPPVIARHVTPADAIVAASGSISRMPGRTSGERDDDDVLPVPRLVVRRGRVRLEVGVQRRGARRVPAVGRTVGVAD